MKPDNDYDDNDHRFDDLEFNVIIILRLYIYIYLVKFVNNHFWETFIKKNDKAIIG